MVFAYMKFTIEIAVIIEKKEIVIGTKLIHGSSSEITQI